MLSRVPHLMEPLPSVEHRGLTALEDSLALLLILQSELIHFMDLCLTWGTRVCIFERTNLTSFVLRQSLSV